MLTFLVILIDITVAYLMGSLSSAVIISRLFRLPDPRSNGSNNPGATNVLRLAGKKMAAAVLIADMLKGVLPVLLAKALQSNSTVLGFTCLAAVLGHIYPIFFEFKGGKGVATALGSFLGFQLIIGAVIIGTWLMIAKISRYSSLASIIALVFAPFYSVLVVGNSSTFLPFSLIAACVVYQHRQNITRLMDGVEPKISIGAAPNHIKK